MGQLTRSLLRGLAVLETIADLAEPAGPTLIAERTGLDKATVSRLVATLAHAGYVQHDPATGRARLTGRVLRLSRTLLDRSDLLTVARPHLAWLRDATEETVHLGQLAGDRVVYVDKLESSRSVRLVSAVGQSMPLHSTGLGKALLAALPDAERDELVARLELTGRTSATLTSAAALRRELAATTVRGWAVDRGENEEGVVCAAAAVTDVDGRVAGAVSVSGPEFRVAPRLEEFASLCHASAERISADLGYVDDPVSEGHDDPPAADGIRP